MEHSDVTETLVYWKIDTDWSVNNRQNIFQLSLAAASNGTPITVF